MNPLPAFRSIWLAWLLSLSILLAWILVAIALDQSIFSAQKSSELLKFGAVNEELVRARDWWRFVASQFLHVRFPLMLFNAICVLVVGALVQRGWGWGWLAVIYLVGGTIGQVAGIASHPDLVSSGASQALMALCGAALVMGQSRVSFAVVLAIVLVQGGLDINAAHAIKAGHTWGFIGGLAVAGIAVLTSRRSRASHLRRVGRQPRSMLIAAAILIAAIIVDVVGVTRPSAVSAVGCVSSIFHSRPDSRRLLAQHRETILMQAALRNLPATLLAAVVVDHQQERTALREFSDCAGSALGVNLSLGLAQMRISTAAILDGKSLGNLSVREYRDLRRHLLDPDQNIAYAARELRALLERSGRYPGMVPATLLNDPAAMALVVTEYRTGRMGSASADARRGASAFRTLALMQDGSLSSFEYENEDQDVVKQRIRDYLSHVYCESGQFDNDVCEGWRRALSGSTAKQVLESQKP